MITRRAFFALSAAVVAAAVCPVEASAAMSSSPLRIGSKGDDVRRLQEILASKGFFKGPQTGNFQQITDRAVRAFQKANGLVVDGVVGRATWGSLLIGSSAPRGDEAVVSSGAVGFMTNTGKEASVQRMLNKHRDALGRPFYTGRIDGIFGKGSMSAYQRFQYDRGLIVKGKARNTVDETAWRVLSGDSQKHVRVGPPRSVSFRNGAVISIAQGSLWLVQDGKIGKRYDVRTAGWNKDRNGVWRYHYTGIGKHRVYDKDPDPSSKRFGEGAMPMSVIFDPNMYIHGSAKFAVERWNGGSFGCINAILADATEIYRFMQVGYTVQIMPA